MNDDIRTRIKNWFVRNRRFPISPEDAEKDAEKFLNEVELGI